MLETLKPLVRQKHPQIFELGLANGIIFTNGIDSSDRFHGPG